MSDVYEILEEIDIHLSYVDYEYGLKQIEKAKDILIKKGCDIKRLKFQTKAEHGYYDDIEHSIVLQSYRPMTEKEITIKKKKEDQAKSVEVERLRRRLKELEGM